MRIGGGGGESRNKIINQNVTGGSHENLNNNLVVAIENVLTIKHAIDSNNGAVKEIAYSYSAVELDRKE